MDRCCCRRPCRLHGSSRCRCEGGHTKPVDLLLRCQLASRSPFDAERVLVLDGMFVWAATMHSCGSSRPSTCSWRSDICSFPELAGLGTGRPSSTDFREESCCGRSRALLASFSISSSHL